MGLNKKEDIKYSGSADKELDDANNKDVDSLSVDSELSQNHRNGKIGLEHNDSSTREDKK